VSWNRSVVIAAATRKTSASGTSASTTRIYSASFSWR
jgi:hypothetical protein